jgi:transposase
MGEDFAAFAGGSWRPGAVSSGQPPVRQRMLVGFAVGRTLVRPARTVRQVKDCAPAFQPLVPCRRLGAGVRRSDRRSRQVDSTIVRAHQQATSGKGEAKDQALARSRGGLTTKIHLLADALGCPLRFIVTAGQVNDITQAPALLDGQSGGDAVLPDKAYDSNALRAIIAEIGATAVIRSNRTRRIIIRTMPTPTDSETASSIAYAGSNTSAASLPVMTGEPRTLPASSISQPQ